MIILGNTRYIRKSVNVPTPASFLRKRCLAKESVSFIPVLLSDKDFKISLTDNNNAYFYPNNNIIRFPERYINTTLNFLLSNSYYRMKGALLIQGLNQYFKENRTFLDSITLFDVLHFMDDCYNSDNFNSKHTVELITIPISIENSEEEFSNLLILPHLYEDIYLILLCPICSQLLECKVNKNFLYRKRKVVFLEDIEHTCKHRKGIVPEYVVLPVKGFYIKDLFSSEKTHKTVNFFHQHLMYPYSIRKRTKNIQEEISYTDPFFPIEGSLVRYRNNSMDNHYLIMESRSFGDLKLVVNDYLHQEIMSNTHMIDFLIKSKKIN